MTAKSRAKFTKGKIYALMQPKIIVLMEEIASILRLNNLLAPLRERIRTMKYEGNFTEQEAVNLIPDRSIKNLNISKEALSDFIREECRSLKPIKSQSENAP